MKSKLLIASLICLLISSLVITGCTEETTPTPTSWGDSGEPQYGGTITLRADEFSSLQFDPWGPPSFSGNWLMHYDCLFSYDWAVDRSEWSFQLEFVPEEYVTGSVVESWEKPDGQTLILHLREGVHFQNKPPVNGREVVASDVVYHLDRLCGTGSGFTERSPFAMVFPDLFVGATAIDDYTVELKFKQAELISLPTLQRPGSFGYVEAPEISQQYGDCSDWRNAVGTGPWILDNYVDGSTLTYVRNPDYWGYDERHPENQLPYADELTVVCITDSATAVAALRTGQIDMMTGIDWQTAQTLSNTNPELQQAKLPQTGNGLLLNLFNEPFTDIRVRKALSMALDRELIAEVHYNNLVEGQACGVISPLMVGYSTPFEEWPADLQEGYSYHPDKARELLAEAGFPEGFSTSCVTTNTHDLELLQICCSMYSDIGVEVEIETFDRGAYTNLTMEGKHEGMAGPEPQGFNIIGTPWSNLLMRMSTSRNPSTFKDPDYDAICLGFYEITDPAKMAEEVKKADMYIIERYTSVLILPNINYNIWQPRLKGYSGERLNNMDFYARWWVD
jgi:peptide/nickel transport system substrate-binding protein